MLGASKRAGQLVDVTRRRPRQPLLAEIAECEITKEFTFEECLSGMRDKCLPRLC